MAEELSNVANDNTNEPQPAAEPAEQPKEAPETILGGPGTTEQKTEPEQKEPAKEPVEYDFKGIIPEGVELDEALTKDFSEIARSMNLTNEQANQMAAFGFKYGEQVATAVRDQRIAEVQKWGEEARTAMGADFSKVMATAAAGIEAVEKTVPGIRQALNETGAGNRIEIIRAMELLGSLVQSDPGKLINVGGAPAPAPSVTWYENTKR